jgi:hypothetical protein
MIYLVLAEFTVKTSDGPTVINAGSMIDLPENKATALIQLGKIQVHKPSWPEWCADVCILSRGQAIHCRREPLCPKYGNGGKVE